MGRNCRYAAHAPVPPWACFRKQIFPSRLPVEPGPILLALDVVVVVGVGGLHDLEVAPVGPGQVAELDQVGLMVDHVVTVGRAAQHVVDDGGHLGAGNPVVGTKVPVGVAADPAVAGRLGHVGVEPVAAGHVAEVAHGVLGLIGEGQGDDAELGPGDGVVGPEGAVGIAGDHAQRGQGIHRGGVPRVGGHVREGLGNGHVLVQQQGVEHLGHLGAGHVVLRAESAIRVAEQVLDVVLGVQQVRHAGVIGVGGLVRVNGRDVGRVCGLDGVFRFGCYGDCGSVNKCYSCLTVLYSYIAF